VNLPKIAFKTGTSYGRRDAWSIGYSSEYTVGVWIGNVNHIGNPELTGGKAAAPLLIDIFNSISSAAQKSIMSRPNDVLMREVCANSGLLPTKRCDHTIEDDYSVRYTLDRYCEFDKEYLISPDKRIQYCPSCLASNNYTVATYQDYPPELLNYWDQIGMKHETIPPHNPKCSIVFSGTGPKIVSPSDAMTYYLASPKQQIALQASSGLDVQDHLWYVDDRFIRREKASKKLFVPLSAGSHTISCVDDRGRMSSIQIKINFIN
jgi:penicillin-binding protein 1C